MPLSLDPKAARKAVMTAKTVARSIDPGYAKPSLTAMNPPMAFKDGGAAQDSLDHQPSEAQKSAGNYRKAHISIHGLDISVENRKGSTRSGRDGGGKRWSVVMPADYGYIKRTEGADGDHVDCYVGPDRSSTHAFIVNQRDARTKKFDEHKVMLGYRSEAEALRDYVRAFNDGKGPQRMGGMQSLSIDAFKKWLKAGDTKKPASHDDIVERALRIAKGGGGEIGDPVQSPGQVRAMSRMDPSTRISPPSIAKEKGGQWLSGSVEGAFEGLKKKAVSTPHFERAVSLDYADANRESIRRLYGDDDVGKRMFAAHEEKVRRHKAINDFVDKQLTRYVKNDMGTLEDPVRALAERGITHIQNPEGFAQRLFGGEISQSMAAARVARKRGKYNVNGEGKSTEAKIWEALTDSSLYGARPAERFVSEDGVDLEKNPWLRKINPETPVYGESQIDNGDLWFGHLVDELHNSVNPAAGLPSHLRLRPESLSRMSVPQAVEHVHNINQWREENIAEANRQKAFNSATHLYKDYPGTDYAWHELRLPEGDAALSDFSKQIMKQEYEDKGIAPRPDVVELQRRRDAREHLENALKYEGECMGHCVGGYTNDVASGKTRILSLRNKKTGMPHATIELHREDPNYEDFKKTLSPEELPVAEAARNFRIQPDDAAKKKHKELEQRFQSFRDSAPPSWSINQIKGKSNAALVDRYKPFAQDFVRSGNWTHVNDAHNAGLLDVREKDPYLHRLMTERGDSPPDYMTDSEYSAAKDKHIPEVTKEQGDHLFGVKPQ